jgi:hypothetical protein
MKTNLCAVVLTALLMASIHYAQLRLAKVHGLAENEGDTGDADKGAPVRLSREWQIDTGFQQQLGRYAA